MQIQVYKNMKSWEVGGLTGYVGAGTMVSSVLEKSIFAAHLLWFGVRIPASLRTLRRPVLHGAVVQLKAFALWSKFPVLVAASV